MLLSQFKPHWSETFEAERARLRQRFPGRLVDLQHIGSTAVAGISARPVVDLLAGVEDAARVETLVADLCRSGYETSPRMNLSLGGRSLLVRRYRSHRNHRLHVVVHGGREWSERIRFRDALRDAEELRDAYDQVKLRWGHPYYGDWEQYVQAKQAFIATVLGHG
jgi:GrpB-like predicted nucleotidyltransferase (UPF0157 family)